MPRKRKASATGSIAEGTSAKKGSQQRAATKGKRGSTGRGVDMMSGVLAGAGGTRAAQKSMAKGKQPKV